MILYLGWMLALALGVRSKINGDSYGIQLLQSDNHLKVLPLRSNSNYGDRFRYDLIENLTKSNASSNFITTMEENVSLCIKDLLHSRKSRSIPEVSNWTLKRMAHFAGASYCQSNLIRAGTCTHCSYISKGTDIFTVYDTGSVLGFIAIDHQYQYIVVSFRGTANIYNILQDLNVNLVNFTPDPNSNSNIKVHSGFFTLYNELKSELIADLKGILINYPHYSLALVGHSLGGAMATYAAAEFPYQLSIPFNRVYTFTFGSPRPGNDNFARFLNTHSPPHHFYRLVNYDDPIPSFPHSGLGYYHPHQELLLHQETVYPCPNNEISLENLQCYAANLIGFKVNAHFNYLGIAVASRC